MTDHSPAIEQELAPSPYRTLLRVIDELRAQRDDRGILQVVATRLPPIVPYDRGLFIYLLTADRRFLSLVYAEGSEAAEALSGVPRPIADGIIASVLRSSQACVVNDVTTLSARQRGPGIPLMPVNLLAIPLQGHTEVLGIMLLYRSTTRIFTPAESDLGQFFGVQVAQAIEHLNLYGVATELHSDLQVIQRIATAMNRPNDIKAMCASVGHELKAMLHHDTYHVYLSDAERTALDEVMREVPTAPAGPQRVLWGEGVVGWVAEHREPQVIDDARRDPRTAGRWRSGDPESMMVAPLLHDDLVVGVIVVGACDPDRFHASHLRTLTIVASQVATAIENTRLLAQERERAVALEEINRLRTDFVTTVSHELRTPLTSIIGFSESLVGYWARMDDVVKLGVVDKIRLSSLRLERLVRDLLAVSRIEEQNVVPRVEVVDCAAVVDQAVAELGVTYRYQSVHLEAPSEPVYALADRDRVHQILVNLLDNALKYSPEGVPVILRWGEQDGHIYLSVTDYGRGIAAEDLPRLFTRFGKIGTTIRAGHIGTGLGLYISRGLAMAMNGSIGVESTPGLGSTFTLTLPIAQRRADIKPQAQDAAHLT